MDVTPEVRCRVLGLGRAVTVPMVSTPRLFPDANADSPVPLAVIVDFCKSCVLNPEVLTR